MSDREKSADADIDELRRERERLLALVHDLSGRFAALNFKGYEMAEEIRRLEMRLSGSEASLRCLEWENRQLLREAAFLRKVLLEYVDPPEAIRELIASYRREAETREPDRS